MVYPSQNDWAYFAGLIDGEGSISMQRSRVSGRKSTEHFIKVQVYNTCRHVLDWLKERWGGSIRRDGTPTGISRRQCYAWSVTGPTAAHLLEQVRPLLQIKHRQAWLALEFMQQRTVFAGKHQGVPANEQALREGFAHAMAYLNGATT